MGDILRTMGPIRLPSGLPCVLLAVAGRLGGSRWGLALIGLPAAVLIAAVLSMLANSGDPRELQAGRSVGPSDFFGDLTHLNWIVCAVLALAIVATITVVAVRRRHA
jgi:hypothetical protein